MTNGVEFIGKCDFELDWGEAQKKFIDLSKGILGRAGAEKAIETILSLDTMADLENLVGALTPSNRG